MQKVEIATWQCEYRLEKRLGDIEECRTPEGRLKFLEDIAPYELRRGIDNCLLNTGIDTLWDLVVGDSTATFNNANATIGVSNSTASATAAQTDLQGSPTAYAAMEATYPTSTAQAVKFKSSFGSTAANFAWNEWVVKRTTCLNRKVEALGTKASGTTWTLEISLTLS